MSKSISSRKSKNAFHLLRQYVNSRRSDPITLGPSKEIQVKAEGKILTAKHLLSGRTLTYQLHKPIEDLKDEFRYFSKYARGAFEILNHDPKIKLHTTIIQPTKNLTPIEILTLEKYNEFHSTLEKRQEISNKSIGDIFNPKNPFDPNQYRFDNPVRNAELCLKAELMGPLNVPTPLLGLMHKLGILSPVLEQEEGHGSGLRAVTIGTLTPSGNSDWLIKEYEDYKAARTDIDVTGRYKELFSIYNQKSYINQPKPESKPEIVMGLIEDGATSQVVPTEVSEAEAA